MRIDQLELALRRRNPWEALDLGLIMLRHWHAPVVRVWFATFVPFSLLMLAVLWQHPSLAFFIIWWLKPIFDRLLLKVFAEASFGAPPTVREVWRAIPQLLRHSGLIAGLSFRRFNTGRSFELPVWQLEGQTNRGGRARLRVLSRKTSGYALWLTFVCLHIVLVFEFGFVALVDLLLPSDGLSTFSWGDLFFGDSHDHYVLIFNLSWLLAESIVEPFYVAAGFSLYLNRRSELEGWDIEIAFRRMAERQQQSPPAVRPIRQNTAIVALIAGCLAWLTLCPNEANAQNEAFALPAEATAIQPQASPLPARKPDGQIRKIADKVLADPVFGREVEELSWRPIFKEGKPVEEKPWWEDTLVALAKMLAIGTRGLLYVIIALACGILLFILYRYREHFSVLSLPKSTPPETLFGLDLRPGSLPDDIPGAALAELAAGRPAGALALLYRGTLMTLIRQRHVEFRAGDTEDNCLQRAGNHIDAAATIYFARLLEAWKRAAYAEMPPDTANTRELCLGWAEHFGTAGQTS